jgi:hypothetical protein
MRKARPSRKPLIVCLLLFAALAAAQAPKPVPEPRKFFDIRVPMVVDVDGAPNAYGPPGKPALDFERNAHKGGHLRGAIVGYLTEEDHRTPVIQGPHDPRPGYYVSTTDLRDESIGPAGNELDDRDPRKYLDATRICYVVLGRFAERHGVRLGDYAVVHSLLTHRTAYAIVGDSGNPTGAEGSLALLQALGYDFHDGKNDAVEAREIIIRYFPNSNPAKRFPHSQMEIDHAAEALHLDRRF